MTPERLYAVKEEMEKAEARKLQPHFVRAFFMQAFKALQCELRPREGGRYEIRYVPGSIRERDRVIGGRDPVLKRYERICFERHQVRMYGKPMASLIHPGHPLMAAITDLIIEAHATKLKQGTVFVDPTDEGDTPKVMIMLDHAVRESPYGQDERQVASRRMQFVQIDAQGTVTSTGWAPHLDLEPLPEEDASLIQDILETALAVRDPGAAGPELRSRKVSQAQRSGHVTFQCRCHQASADRAHRHAKSL
ncbi:MAG: hypothetical protein U5L00_11580 [Desulfovermiculus sp.]|nr:hypothetical protein [Desulfovermiculus sp.]